MPRVRSALTTFFPTKPVAPVTNIMLFQGVTLGEDYQTAWGDVNERAGPRPAAVFRVNGIGCKIHPAMTAMLAHPILNVPGGRRVTDLSGGNPALDALPVAAARRPETARRQGREKAAELAAMHNVDPRKAGWRRWPTTSLVE